MQKKKKKTRLFIFLIICFVLVPFLLTKGCNYMESLNQAKNSVSEPITSISEQIQPSACVYTHAHTHARTHSRPHYAGAYAHERAHIRTHNEHVYAQMHSISKANWIGTAVPNTGYVENIYLNYNLTDNEILNIINTLEFDENGFYWIVQSQNDYNKNLAVVNFEGIYVIFTDFGSYPYLWGSDNYEDLGIQKGWAPGLIELNLTFEIYDNVVSQSEESNNIGYQNNKLLSLFSITPFEQSSSNELSIGNLFTQLGNAIIIFGGAVVNVFISMEPIFWNNGPTLIFILLIASVSFALVFWGIELLISLIGVFKTKRKRKK